MIIPLEQINEETLTAIIEEFILREGTDYGEAEVSLNQKCGEVQKQLESKDVLIIYSELSESVTLIHKHQFNEKMTL